MHGPMYVKFDKIFIYSLSIPFSLSGDPHDPEIVCILILVI